MSHRHNEGSDPGPTVGGLLQLVTDLEALGIEVPDGERFVDRALDMPTLTAPVPLTDVLHASTEDILTHARAVALHAAASIKGASNVLADLQAQVCAEYAAVIRESADDIVAQLRPEFDRGIAAARDLRAMGVGPDDRPEALLSRSTDVIAAWQAFTAETPRVLETIAEVRIDMSRVAGVPPRPERGARPGPREFGAAFNVPQFDRDSETLWQKWLRLAPSAELVPPSAITPLAELAHSQIVNPDVLAAVAQGRHDARHELHPETDGARP